jgi:hypothetical protein
MKVFWLLYYFAAGWVFLRVAIRYVSVEELWLLTTVLGAVLIFGAFMIIIVGDQSWKR